MNAARDMRKKETRLVDFPESQVGFPERNDVSPVEDERIHVDLETFSISRKSSLELDRELNGRNQNRDSES